MARRPTTTFVSLPRRLSERELLYLASWLDGEAKQRVELYAALQTYGKVARELKLHRQSVAASVEMACWLAVRRAMHAARLADKVQRLYGPKAD